MLPKLSPRLDLVRLALPRRVYTQSHVDRIIEICGEIAQRTKELQGMEITYSPPYLKHFTARFRPLKASRAIPPGGGPSRRGRVDWHKVCLELERG